MSDYKSVKDALGRGVEPALLCSTCPWDRFCITPPSMTSSEVDAEIAKATQKDEDAAKAEDGKGSFPIGMLLSTVLLSGKDTEASLCPVFALRLRSGDGGVLATGLRDQMRAWDDNHVGGAS